MRKLFFSFLLAATVTGVHAQKLEDVQKDLSNNKFNEAKEKIDKFLNEPKNQNNAPAWYYKGKVYTSLAAMDSTHSLTYDAAYTGFESFKKYQQMDAKNTLMILDQNVGLFQIYDLYYNQGVRKYNEKDYAAAFEKMKKALEVEKYIFDKGYSFNDFSFTALDTQLVNLTASAAYLAKKEAEAIPYFEKLAEAGVTGEEYKEVYALLVDYFVKNNNEAKVDKYLAIGKKIFPDEEYWTSVEFGVPGEDQAAKIQRYEEMMKKYPDNFTLAMDYAIEMFNNAYSNEEKPADYAARQAKAEKALENAIAVKSTATANFVMSQHKINEIYDLEDEARAIKGNTPADQAKRKAITEKMNKKYEELFTYSQKAYELFSEEGSALKPQDKANYRKVVNQLIDYHTRKKQTDKVAMYQEKLKSM
jgi:hypothetical protein